MEKSCKSRKYTTIVSWNVNSIRSRVIDFDTAKCKLKERTILDDSPMGRLIKKVKPTIICIQETKCANKNLGCLNIKGFETYWNCADKAGYSGVSIWSREKPLNLEYNLPNLNDESKSLLTEGRIITAYFKDFVLVNTYTPNTLRAGPKPKGGWSHAKDEKYKFIKNRKNWDKAICKHLEELKNKYKKVIWCGDMNVARTPLDLYQGVMTQMKLENATDESRIKDLEKRVKHFKNIDKNGGGAGYRLIERKGIEKILDNGFVDVYRELYPQDYGFTYWDMIRPQYRPLNQGMRIDYFIVTPNLLKNVKSMKIYKELGETKPVASDHAAIVLKLKN